MHAEVVRRLRCPVCRAAFDPPAAALAPLRCAAGHSFDQARQGYVQLSAAPLAHHGDTPEMVGARDTFLATGAYDMISTALRDAAVRHLTRPGTPAGGAARTGEATARPGETAGGAARTRESPLEAAPTDGAAPGGFVLDVGAGTGWHLAAVLDGLPGARGLAADASKAAARRAARAHPRMDSVVCDAWGVLPVADGVVDVLLNVFAPRSAAEFARVLRPDGLLLVVTPAAGHLAEIVAPLGLLRVDPAKPERLAGTLDAHFAPAGRDDLRHVMALDHASVTTLVGMGPSAWHTDPGVLAARVAALPDPVTVTAAATLSAYRLR